MSKEIDKTPLKNAYHRFDIARLLKDYKDAVEERYEHSSRTEENVDSLEHVLVHKRSIIFEKIEEIFAVLSLYAEGYSEKHLIIKESLERAFILYEVSVIDMYSGAALFFEDIYDRNSYFGKVIFDTLLEVKYMIEDELTRYRG